MTTRASSNFLPPLSASSYVTKFCKGAARNTPPLTKGLIALAGLTYGISYAVQGITALILNTTYPGSSGNRPLDNLQRKAIIHLAIPVGVSAAMTFISRMVFKAGYGRTHFVALALFTTFISALHTGMNYLKTPDLIPLPDDPDDLPVDLADAQDSQIGATPLADQSRPEAPPNTPTGLEEEAASSAHNPETLATSLANLMAQQPVAEGVKEALSGPADSTYEDTINTLVTTALTEASEEIRAEIEQAKQAFTARFQELAPTIAATSPSHN